MSHPSKILLCRCDYYHIVSEDTYAHLSQALAEAGVSFESVADLCELAAAKDPAFSAWAGTDRLAVVACYRRAVRWLFHHAGVPLNEDRVRLFNARTGDIEQIISTLTADGGACKTPVAVRHTDQKGDWIPWFPVIDYQRCVNCKQCLNFCLFGVYALSGDTVEVAKPQGCKTNCPACARVCPQRAIIFPKYDKSPINGDEVDESALDDEKERSELEELLGGDIHEVIRKRKARRLFAPAEEAAGAPSAQQKFSRLARLQNRLDIPQEVLDSLSPHRANRQEDTSAGNDECPNAGICQRDCQKQGGEQGT